MLGGGRPAASPHEQPAAIASLAKVMTAYVTLERYPLRSAQDGFTITVTEDQAWVEAQGESAVAVPAGGCVAFFTHVTVGRHGLTAAGMVPGQGSDTSVILAAADEAASQLVESVGPAIRVRTIAALGAGVPGGDAGRPGRPRLLAPGRVSA